MCLVFSVIAGATICAQAEPPATPAPAPVAPPKSVVLQAAPAAPTVPVATPATPATNAGGGKIQFEMPTYDFGKSKAGDPVKYTFVFTNTGTETLEVKNVRPGCGCTTAGDWTRKVEPGQTGSIPIQVNIAATWPNGPVGKYVNVDSSDPTQPTVQLNIRGTIWKPIEVTPQIAMLNNVPAESPESVTSTVTITNNMEELVDIFEPESNNKSFTAEIKTNTPGKGYQLVIKMVPPLSAGSVQGQITAKTSSTNSPTVSLTAYATVVAALSVIPPQVTLPFAPITSKLAPSVTIQNNSTNVLTLSEPTVNAKDVEVQLNELQPGKTFTATLKIPEGFEVAQGQKLEFSVKTSHPQFPLIKVPITQMQRPVPPPVPPGVQIKPVPSAALAKPAAPPNAAAK